MAEIQAPHSGIQEEGLSDIEAEGLVGPAATSQRPSPGSKEPEPSGEKQPTMGDGPDPQSRHSVYCGADGWAHLAAVIDCHDREIVGYEFALSGRAKEAERALESGCLRRFGMVFPKDEERPVLRGDKGLVFLSRRFRAACKQYGSSQETITP